MPRQIGKAHLNGRPHSFWTGLFEERGFACLDLFRPKIWHNSAVKPWYAQNTFLFVAESAREKFASVQSATLVNVYHPLLVNSLVKGDARAGISDPTSPPPLKPGSDGPLGRGPTAEPWTTGPERVTERQQTGCRRRLTRRDITQRPPPAVEDRRGFFAGRYLFPKTPPKDGDTGPSPDIGCYCFAVMGPNAPGRPASRRSLLSLVAKVARQPQHHLGHEDHE